MLVGSAAPVAATPAAAVGRPAAAANRRHRQPRDKSTNYIRVLGNHVRLKSFKSKRPNNYREIQKQIQELKKETYGSTPTGWDEHGSETDLSDYSSDDDDNDISDISFDSDSDIPSHHSDVESDSLQQAMIDIGWLAGNAQADYDSDASDAPYNPDA